MRCTGLDRKVRVQTQRCRMEDDGVYLGLGTALVLLSVRGRAGRRHVLLVLLLGRLFCDWAGCPARWEILLRIGYIRGRSDVLVVIVDGEGSRLARGRRGPSNILGLSNRFVVVYLDNETAIVEGYAVEEIKHFVGHCPGLQMLQEYLHWRVKRKHALLLVETEMCLM